MLEQLKKLKTFGDLDISENLLDYTSVIADLVRDTKIKTDDRLINKIDNLLIFINDQSDLNYKILLVSKVSEIIRLIKDPLVFIVILKNSINTKPDYNLVSKIVTNKGYDKPKLLNILFTDNDNLHETIKIIQLLIQSEITFTKLIDLLIKFTFIEFILLTEIKSNSWLKEFYNKDNVIDFCIEYLTESN